MYRVCTSQILLSDPSFTLVNGTFGQLALKRPSSELQGDDITPFKRNANSKTVFLISRRLYLVLSAQLTQ